MKIVKAILVLALLLTGFTQLSHPTAVSALSKTAQQQCRSDWNNKTVKANRKNELQIPAKYKNSKCPQSKGGNCTIERKAGDPPQDGVIKCSKPSSDGSGSADGNTDPVGDVSDPALNFSASSCTSGTNCNFVTKYVNPFIKFLSALVGIVVVISIIIGAIQYTTSGGDPSKTAAAKGRIFKALTALVLYIFLFALLQWIVPGGLV